MSMSTSVIGYRDPDEKWLKMKKVYDACVEGGIEPPEEVHEFFGWEEPTDYGIEVDLKKICEKYNRHNGEDGWKIEISKLPPNIKYICFINSY